jgi:hypothetical protein
MDKMDQCADAATRIDGTKVFFMVITSRRIDQALPQIFVNGLYPFP